MSVRKFCWEPNNAGCNAIPFFGFSDQDHDDDGGGVEEDFRYAETPEVTFYELHIGLDKLFPHGRRIHFIYCNKRYYESPTISI